MAEELENQGTEQTPEADVSNNAPTPDELAALKAQLEEEQAVLADARAQLTARDDRIAALEGELNQEKTQREQTMAELQDSKEAHAQAVSHYLNAQRVLNRGTLPEAIIRGETIRDIDDSVSEALAIAEAVKTTLAAEAKNARVPAGAPTRAIDMDALTPEEKIKVGLSQEKGGTS